MDAHTNEDENLKKLIRQAGEDKPALNFTEMVLKGVQAEIHAGTATDFSLKSLLQTHGIEQPSADFQTKLTAQLQPATSIQYKPIISGKTWYGIAAAVAVVLLVCYMYPSAATSETPGFIRFLGHNMSPFSISTDKIRGMLELPILTLVGLAALLIIDHFLRRTAFFDRLAKS